MSESRGTWPVPVTAFVGRVLELQALHAAVPAAPLTTLIGPAGAGKTRLALAFASEAAPIFTAGCAVADLSAVRPDCVAEAAAAALNVTERPGQLLPQAMHERLGDGRCLLVLDGCTHPEAAADLLRSLLTGCPDLVVLATARERLGLHGERTVSVAPLGEADAVALYLDRAGGEPGFARELCAWLGGSPLAVELVAARLAELGPDGLRREVGGARRELREVIEWSCAGLSDPERRLLLRLAVFAGSFDVDAAACVGANGDVDAVGGRVRRLAGAALLALDGTTGRWRVPRPVRACALEQLRAAAGELDARRRHLEWAAATAAELEGMVEAGLPWQERFDLVANDLRDALEEAPAGRPEAHRLGRALGHLCYARRFLMEARIRYEQAAAITADAAAAARDLRAAADVSMAQHLGEPAFQLLAESARSAGEAGDEAARAVALASAVSIGNRCPATFTQEVPHETLTKLLAEARRAAPSGDALVAAHLAAAEAWNATGVKTIPDHGLAWDALRAARASHDPVLIVAALDAVIMGEAGAGRFEEARRLGRERIEQFHRLVRHDPRTGLEIIDTLHVGPLVAMAAGDLKAALAAARLASDDPSSGLYMRNSKHVVPLTLSGRFVEALDRAEAMWDGWQRAGCPAARWMAPSVHAAALIHGLRGRDGDHEEWLDRACRMASPRGTGHISDSFAAFADPRLALHRGAIGEALAAAVDLSAMPPWRQAVHQYFDACSWATAAEVAVIAGLPDAGDRLAAAAPAGDESAWAAACLLRAGGRLRGDRDALRRSADEWGRIGARFERACTLALLPEGAADGLRDLRALGCREPVPVS